MPAQDAPSTAGINLKKMWLNFVVKLGQFRAEAVAILPECLQCNITT